MNVPTPGLLMKEADVLLLLLLLFRTSESNGK
jgi:hypothetical protein